LAPVAWSHDGWPTIGNKGTIELKMAAPALNPQPSPPEPARDEFDAKSLGLTWNFLRNPRDADWSLAARPGCLRLNGSAVSLNDQDTPAFVGRRQTSLACRATTQLEFEPTVENEEAGLVVRGNDANHYDLGVTIRNGRRQVFFRKVLKGQDDPTRYEDLPPGPVVLSAVARPHEYEFTCQPAVGSPISLGKAATKDLSTEKIGGFTGAYFGMYATGNGKKSTAPADFAWFDYEVDTR
jgi:alpha-N-arabinofuranosidase